ncbi:MAG: hypothetical protein KatS3mg129_2774 [Leptospiraceae bacterium]|nr:MAG: hypothetical protein KatS3mg129_2774 [Leptospiraceae bacterium]
MDCGYTLKPVIINNTPVYPPYDHICSIQNQIKDQKELIMEELGIKPEDLGVKDKKVKFRD